MSKCPHERLARYRPKVAQSIADRVTVVFTREEAERQATPLAKWWWCIDCGARLRLWHKAPERAS